MATFPAAVASDSTLYIAVNATSTQLTDNPLSNVATTVNVVSTTGFPTVGFISIDNEIIKYTGTTGTSFTGCTRGSDGTSAASHVQNSQVFHNAIAAHHNASKDEIIAVETFLNEKMGTTGGAYTASRALSTDGSGVIAVATTTLTELQAIHSLTASRALVTDGSGLISVSATTAAEIAFVNGVTSAIQTQLNAKATDTLVVHLAGTESITGAKTFSAALTMQANSSLTASSSGASLNFTVSNTSNTASSDALIKALVAGSSGGDAYYETTVNGVTTWTFGLDNSDSDSWVLSASASLGTSNSIRVSGTTAGVAIKGTNTNDTPPAGFVGEIIESVAGVTNAPTSGQFGDLASISLTAGRWLVSVTNYWDGNGATWSHATTGISSTTGNSATGLTVGSNRADFNFANSSTAITELSMAIPDFEVKLTGTTTYYLKFRAVYTAGTPQAYGRITAIRQP